jgi:ribonuclease HI
MSWMRNGKKPIVVYTDGGCHPNPGAGGWACILLHPDGTKQELSGKEDNVTNNQMELLACIKALAALPHGSSVYLHTDSQYVKRGIVSWVHGWKANGWKTSLGQPVKNADLWQELVLENDRHIVSWLWVRGHDGNEHNERCDELALAARRGGG